MRRGLVVLIGCALAVVVVSPAAAQATCRLKCVETEQACLKRTGNKGQCGEKAETCLAACRRS
jgi:hypothetical protein